MVLKCLLHDIECSYIDRRTRGHENVKYLEDLETGDIQYADEELPLVLCVQLLVNAAHEPLEHPVVDGLRHGVHAEHHLDTDIVSLISKTSEGHFCSASLQYVRGNVFKH